MRIRRFSIKLSPFRWTRTKVKPIPAAPVPRQANGQTWPAPGWYWAPTGYVFWDGHRWTIDACGREVF